jgi:subtilisin-like proprotein convertase family protein
MTRFRIRALVAVSCSFVSLTVVAIGWAGTDKGGGSGLNDPRSGAALNREAAQNPQPAPPAVYPENPQQRINVLAVNDPTDDTTAQDTQSETSVAALGSNVVVAFNDSGSFTGSNNHFTGYASSSNTGGTFTDHGTLPASGEGDAGDPALARDNATGAFYLATLGFTTGERIQVFKSIDGGATFGAPVNATPGYAGSFDFQDKEWLAVDNRAGTGQGNVYLCWTNFNAANTDSQIRFTRSTDDGASFGPSGGTLLSNGGQGCFVAVGPDHSVDVFFYRGTASGGFMNGGDNKLFMRRSTDRGVSFGVAHQVADLATSTINGGLALNGGLRSNSFPHAAVNPVNGDIVVVYNDDPNLASTADNGDVFYTKSTDDGVTWSPRVRVNEVATRDQFFPTVAITPNGTSIMFGYYDRSQDAANSRFHRQGRAGTVNTTTGAIALRRSFQLGPNTPVVIGQDPVINSTYMGDYDQIDATNAAFHSTWSDNRDGNSFHAHQPDVRYAQISTAVTNSDIGVTVTPTPASIDAGETTDLAVKVTASGGLAKDVFVNLSPAAGLKYQSGPASCEVDGGFVGCSLGNIAAGASKTVHIPTAGLQPAGTRTAEATATTSSKDTNQANNTGSATVTVAAGTPVTSTYSTGNIAVPINDNSTVDVPLSVPNVGNVLKAQALVRLNHTFDADLEMFLIDPSSQFVELSTNNGSNGDNYGSGTNNCAGTPTTFTDSAATPITAGTAPFAGSFKPEQPLAGVNGDPTGGTWKLRVADVASFDTGTIGCFKLRITHP